jgi:hypothetical protein
LKSRCELPAADKQESYYQQERAKMYPVPQKLGVKLGRYPEQLSATDEQVRKEAEQKKTRKRWRPLSSD